MAKRLHKKGERKKPTKKFYEERFKKIPEGMQFGDFIFSRKTLEWRCAYSAKSKARSNLPKHIFVSDHGDVISVYGKDSSLLERSYNRDYAKIGGGHKNDYGIGKPLFIHILVALCFDSSITPAAKVLLELEGFNAFGKGTDQDHIKVHHKDENPRNNTPDNLVIMTCWEHSMLHKWKNAVKKWNNAFWDMKPKKLPKKKQSEYAEMFR